MTATTIITDQPIEYVYTAAAAQDEFDFNFQIFNGAADLYVEVEGAAVGAFTYTLVGDEGGYITLDDPCVGGETVLVRRVLAYERVTQFPNTGPVAMPVVNQELNRIVGMIQQLVVQFQELSEEIGYNDERAVDAVAAALSAGSNISIDYDDGNAIITIANDLDAEFIRDTIGSTLIAGAGIEVTANDVANTITIAQTFGVGGTMTAEDARDVIATALVAGAGITITPNDGADTITIANSSGAYTDENARDAIAAALVEGTGIDITVDDAGNTITIAQVLAKTMQYFIPAVAMKPTVTSGAAPGSTATATNGINYDSLDFDGSAVETAEFLFRMPKQVDEAGSFKARFGWTSEIATGSVRWGVQCLVLRDNSVVDTATSSGAEITDTTNGPTKLNSSADTAGFTITGLAAEDLIVFKVYRDPANGADDLAGDAKLLWMDLKIPIAGFDDA